ncbi:MAG TPA: homocysteine S-methyltransferase family protein [Gammaproteobacteria bacterium]|nr:homocysteine S-methyltransferase family protein [Gammaproteobacteria bacterium]
MSAYRHALPQMGARPFLTDVGLETMLVFHDGLALPDFAAFTLLDTKDGTERLRRYYRRCLAHATSIGCGFILESPTWRANPDWGARLGYTPAGLADRNVRAIALMAELREEFASTGLPIVISGNLGPRGDAYDPARIDAVGDYEAYHRTQIESFACTAVDLVSAGTINNVPEAIGIVRAATKAGLPVVISFTVETDGRLPTGVSLREAIETVDAATNAAPAYYMLNCAHPDHFEHVLDGEAWCRRLRGIRANASRRSHAELDESTTLDDGDPAALGAAYAALRARLPQLTILGGCCGTDHRHLEAIAAACIAQPSAPPQSHEHAATAFVVSTTLLLFGYLMVCLTRAFEYPSIV